MVINLATVVKSVDTQDLKSCAAGHASSILASRTNNRRSCMSKQQEVIDRAYGNMPKEVGFSVNWEFIPSWRGLKYYWYKLIRKVTR